MSIFQRLRALVAEPNWLENHLFLANVTMPEQLVGKRTGIINRMKAAFVRLGIRGFNPKLRNAPERLAVLRTPEGSPIPPNTLAELRREMVHLRFVNQQIKQIEDARQKQLEDEPQRGSNARVLELQRISGLGIETADMLVRDVFSRDLRDRRAVARYAGLTEVARQI